MSSKLPRDPKWKVLSTRAKVAYVEMACEVAEQETDGVYTPVARAASPTELELLSVGLIERRGRDFFLPAFTKWNLTRAQLDGKRMAGAKGAAIRWTNGKRIAGAMASANGSANGSPNREVEVEVEPEEETTKARPTDGNPNQPSHDQIYLAERIGDLSAGAIVKLNKAYGRLEVESAMRELHGFPPEERINSPFAYLEAICQAAS